MFSVALIGPDGAGKTTIGRRLEATLALPVKYMYMGVNRDASNHMLITTRVLRALKKVCGAGPDNAGPPDPNRMPTRPRSVMKRAALTAKSYLGLANRVADEWFRQMIARVYQEHGYIVVFDRHYFSDYYAYDIAPARKPRPLVKRLHGFMLEHLYPKPELVVYLDAPAEVLFARKGEGTIEALERRRSEYLEMRRLVEHFVIVDATQPVDSVARQVAETIVGFYKSRGDGRKQRSYGWDKKRQTCDSCH